MLLFYLHLLNKIPQSKATSLNALLAFKFIIQLGIYCLSYIRLGGSVIFIQTIECFDLPLVELKLEVWTIVILLI